MTITRPPAPVPKDLTIARLYLDDVEEIVKILLDAEKNLNLQTVRAGPDDAVKIEFIVGKGAKARTCSAVTELRAIAKSTKHFNLEVARDYRYRASLSIGGFTNGISTRGLSYDQEVGVYHRIEHIFKQRRLLFRELSSKLKWWGWGLIGLVLYLTGPVTGSLSKIMPVGWAIAVVCAGVVLYFSVLVAGDLGSIVVFRNFSEQDEIQREQVGKFFFEAAKLIAAFLLGMLSLYLAHKYWR